MDFSTAVDRMARAPLGQRADTLCSLCRQLPPGTDLTRLGQAAMSTGLSKAEVESLIRHAAG